METDANVPAKRGRGRPRKSDGRETTQVKDNQEDPRNSAQRESRERKGVSAHGYFAPPVGLYSPPVGLDEATGFKGEFLSQTSAARLTPSHLRVPTSLLSANQLLDTLAPKKTMDTQATPAKPAPSSEAPQFGSNPDFSQFQTQEFGYAGLGGAPSINQTPQLGSDLNFTTAGYLELPSSSLNPNQPSMDPNRNYTRTSNLGYDSLTSPSMSANQILRVGHDGDQTSMVGNAGLAPPSLNANSVPPFGIDRNQAKTPPPNDKVQEILERLAELAAMSPPVTGPLRNVPENNHIFIGDTSCSVEDINAFLRCYLRLKMNDDSPPDNPALEPNGELYRNTEEHIHQLQMKWQSVQVLYGDEYELHHCATRGRNIGTAIFTRARETNYTSLLRGIAMHFDRLAQNADTQLKQAEDDPNECEEYQLWKWLSWIGVMSMDKTFFGEIRDTIIRLTRAERQRLDALAGVSSNGNAAAASAALPQPRYTEQDLQNYMQATASAMSAAQSEQEREWAERIGNAGME